MTIYKECDGDMEATIDELLYLVALTEAKMREAEEKKRRVEMEEQMRQSQRKVLSSPLAFLSSEINSIS